MTGWGAVQYVGGGFSLVAFIVSAIFYAYRERLHTKAAVIKSAPTHDRLEAIATEAEFFRVNVSNLSTEQQSNIVLEQLRMSSRRTLFLFLSFVLIAIICGAIALAAILLDTPVIPGHANAGQTDACKDEPAQFPETEQTRVTQFIAHPMDPPRQTNWTHPTPDRWIESSLGVQNVFSTTRRIHNGFCDGTVVTAVDRANIQLLISDRNCLSKGIYVRILPACAWNGMPQMEDAR
jgi:hypothetical protein